MSRLSHFSRPKTEALDYIDVNRGLLSIVMPRSENRDAFKSKLAKNGPATYMKNFKISVSKDLVSDIYRIDIRNRVDVHSK